jgi:hypothetical protein
VCSLCAWAWRVRREVLLLVPASGVRSCSGCSRTPPGQLASYSAPPLHPICAALSLLLTT